MQFLRSASGRQQGTDNDDNNNNNASQQQQQYQFDDGNIHKTSNDMDDDNNYNMDEIETARRSPIAAVARGTSTSPLSNSNPKKTKMIGGGSSGKKQPPPPKPTTRRRRAPPPPPPIVPESKSRRLLLAISSISILGVAAYLTWKYGLDEPTNWAETQEGAGNLWQAAGNKWKEWDLGNFTDVLDGLDNLDFGNLFDSDPKLGDNTTYLWQSDFIDSSNGGLHLTLKNALDDNWQTEFEQAVSDWQESDALVLQTERVDVDHSCTPVDGYMVVCNANFGATGWVGINENSIVRDVIVSSVAKMNEYYLMNADYDHRRFTMCHEIGHGFGLPHTDENPYNSNLGNCLDYTDDPSSNILPGDVNMVKLRGMYLTRRLRRVEDDGTVVERTELVVRR